jgi:hypothetical protein
MIDPVVTRLRDTVPALKLVGGAADFQNAAESKPKVTPAAFVIPLEEMPSPNSMGNVVIQRVAARIGVVWVVRNVSDTKGVQAKDDLDVLRKAGKDALLGWSPSGGFAPFERGPSALLAFRDGHMWWQDIYQTSFYDRSVL